MGTAGTAVWEHDIGLACYSGPTRVMERAHRHHDIEINVVSGGTLGYLYGGRYIEVTPRMTAMFWASIPHQLVSVPEGTFVQWLNLPLATVLPWGLNANALAGLLRGVPVQVPIRRAVPRFADWSVELAGADDELREIALLEIQAYVRRLTREGLCQTGFAADDVDGDVGRVATMAHFVATHCRERITVSDVAASVHLHPHYAMTLFRRVIGLTVGRYLEQCRIAEAQRLLLTGEASTSDVAHSAGFGSVSRFYASFTASCGQSPAAYRRAYRELMPH